MPKKPDLSKDRLDLDSISGTTDRYVKDAMDRAEGDPLDNWDSTESNIKGDVRGQTVCETDHDGTQSFFEIDEEGKRVLLRKVVPSSKLSASE